MLPEPWGGSGRRLARQRHWLVSDTELAGGGGGRTGVARPEADPTGGAAWSLACGRDVRGQDKFSSPQTRSCPCPATASPTNRYDSTWTPDASTPSAWPPPRPA